jgi:Tfp pilus assembly protein PilV
MEAMIAMVIVLIAAVGIIGTSNQGVLLTAEGRHLTRASALAQEFAALSQVWSYSDTRLSAAGSPHDGATELTTTYNGTSNAALAAAGSGFTRTWTVADLANSNGSGTFEGKAIVLTIGWTQNGQARSATFYMTRVNPRDHL